MLLDSLSLDMPPWTLAASETVASSPNCQRRSWVSLSSPMKARIRTCVPRLDLVYRCPPSCASSSPCPAPRAVAATPSRSALPPSRRLLRASPNCFRARPSPSHECNIDLICCASGYPRQADVFYFVFFHDLYFFVNLFKSKTPVLYILCKQLSIQKL
jgi:hypothetical protein